MKLIKILNSRSKQIFTLIFFAIILCSCEKNDNELNNSSDIPDGYNLVWSDEFDIDGLPNSSKWDYDIEANETGWYNDELQYYSYGRLENSIVSNGKLIITARKERLTNAEDYGGQEYTSARLITMGKANWEYGFMEIRAKLPCGLGTWPAIWLLGDNDIPWPGNGEIDIMEQVGLYPNEISGTVHTTSTAGTFGDGSLVEINDACEVFHNYQLTWTSEKITIAVDGTTFHTYLNQGTGIDSWPFDNPHYLLLNLAIGGEMAGPTVDDSIFPIQLEIEYVRIYQN